MRVLMLGWEFPPYISGGLGTACYGLTKAMTRLGAQILYVLPTAATPVALGQSTEQRSPLELTGLELMRFMAVPSAIRSPYEAANSSAHNSIRASAGPSPAVKKHLPAGPMLRVVGTGATGGYEGNLILRITEYADRCVEMTADESFDVIHAHDWVTFPAGMAIAQRSGCPLVVHVHSTEFDRSGEWVNPAVYDIEREGVRQAAGIIAVSNLTKGIVVSRYGAPADKVHVVYNGIEARKASAPPPPKNGDEKVVLFLGRITMQKGPEFFVRAAQRILGKLDNVRFVIAGWGDLGPKVIEQVIAMGLGSKVRFTGFIRGQEVEQAYRMADVYVMPSVSEPFGLTALEAIQQGVPVVLSRNSGVAEVLHRGAIKCDFWDVDVMADRIVAVLTRPELAQALRDDGAKEIVALTWEAAARKCVQVYWQTMDGLGDRWSVRCA